MAEIATSGSTRYRDPNAIRQPWRSLTTNASGNPTGSSSCWQKGDLLSDKPAVNPSEAEATVFLPLVTDAEYDIGDPGREASANRVGLAEWQFRRAIPIPEGSRCK